MELLSVTDPINRSLATDAGLPDTVCQIRYAQAFEEVFPSGKSGTGSVSWANNNT